MIKYNPVGGERSMNTICRDIFRAIHEEKWLSIEYRNSQNEEEKLKQFKAIITKQGLE